MNSTVTEVATDTFRISTFHPESGIQFNQYLVRDDEPFLMHTGMRKAFPLVHEAVATVMPPAKLRWIGYSHFEPDECGALNEWLAVAPQAQPVANFVGSRVMLSDFSDRPARCLNDGEVVSTGRHRLQFLSTPHLPHGWDAGLFFDETEKTLFCSDLFFHPGNPAPLVESDVVGPARESIKASLNGPMAHDLPYTPSTDATLRRLARLKPETMALMHGSTFRGDGEKAILELAGVLKQVLS
jgi:flavorubredoxin